MSIFLLIVKLYTIAGINLQVGPVIGLFDLG